MEGARRWNRYKKIMSEVTEIVRELRQKSTPAEKILWKHLRAHRFKGLKIKRQKPIIFTHDGAKRFFVADFLCLNDKTVIEVDGKIHDYQKEHDEFRDEILHLLGYKVIRIKNEEILRDINGVLMRLNKVLTSPQPSPVEREL
jgi:very-short-patch-repair endonuclease